MSKEYLRPGVFVEEVPPGEQPVQAVGTSTGAFVGIAEKGALDTPKLVTNWSQFVKDFGGRRRDSFLAHAVQGFFLNGGSRCFVVRVASATAAIASMTLSDRAGTPLDTLGVQALNEGEWGNRLSLDLADGTKIPATEFMIIVKLDGEVVETWDDLSLDPEAENYVEAVVIDLDAGTIRVLHGKGDRSRTVGIDAGATDLIRTWLKVREGLQPGVGTRIFCTHSGGPMNTSYVRQFLPRLARRAGIEKRVHPHGLRHTHAAELAAENVPINVIQAQLGHSNAATTSRYIQHIAPQQLISTIRQRTWQAS